MGLRASLGEWWEAGRKENREGREGRWRWDGTRGYQREGSDGQKRGGRRRRRGGKQTGGDEDESERRARERERQSKGWKRRRGRDDVGAEKGGKVIKKEKVKRKMAHTQTGGRSVYGLPASCAQRAEAACVERWHTTSQVLTHVVNTYEHHERVTAGSAFVCKRERGGKTALVSLQLLIQNEPQRGGFIQSMLKHTVYWTSLYWQKSLWPKKKKTSKRESFKYLLPVHELLDR